MIKCASYGIMCAELEALIVFNDDTLAVRGNVYYAPIYMAMFLAPPPLPDKMIYEV